MDVVIIGGGAAGMSAASKAKRVNPDLNVIVLEKGKYVSYAECGIPYFLEGVVPSINDLIHYRIEEFTKNRGISVRTGIEVLGINRDERTLDLDNGERMRYDRLVIATGVSPKIPENLQFEGATGLRSLESASAIQEELKSASSVGIIGDGVLGIELAASLVQRGLKVTVYSRHNALFRHLGEFVGAEFRKYFESKVRVIKNSVIEKVARNGSDFEVHHERMQDKYDLVLFATGTYPNTDLAKKCSIITDERGLIVVNEKMQSSDPDIYAAGDCATTINIVTGKKDWHPLAQISNKMGRVAGSNIGGSVMTFPGSIGTTLVKVFDYEIGFTGLNLDEALKAGFAAKSVNIKAKSRANYYPGGSDVFLSLVYDTRTKRILGAQVVSEDGGAWRLNTLAVAVQNKMTADDLFYTDLGYTPPFGPVWDPIIIAADSAMK